MELQLDNGHTWMLLVFWGLDFTCVRIPVRQAGGELVRETDLGGHHMHLVNVVFLVELLFEVCSLEVTQD